jgi:hypothetical protein
VSADIAKMHVEDLPACEIVPWQKFRP